MSQDPDSGYITLTGIDAATGTINIQVFNATISFGTMYNISITGEAGSVSTTRNESEYIYGWNINTSALTDVALPAGTYTATITVPSGGGGPPTLFAEGVGLVLSYGGGGGGGPVPCFPTGTLIRTIAGDKPVETLKTGDYVRTADNRVVPVRLYSFHVAKATEVNAPYVVPANSLGPRQPARTLHLSPHHAFQIRPNVWQMPLLAAERSEAIQQYGLGEPVTYYHVECPNFFRDNLVADGVVCESFGSNHTKGLKGIYRFSPALGGYTRVSMAKFAKTA